MLSLLVLACLVLIVALGAVVLARRPTPPAGPAVDPEQVREVASKLKAAGAVDEAALLYEDYLAWTSASAEARAKIAYSLGTSYLTNGQYEKALRWFYEAETLGAGPLDEEVGQKIVHSLERMGRFHAARSALRSRVDLTPEEGGEAVRAAGDPVVARIGEHEITRSEVERALDDLPPEIARNFSGKAQREEFLKKYVADELIWRKAQKLEYDKDPEVRRRLESLSMQFAVAKFVEKEVAGKIEVDESDLQNFFEANRSRYEKAVEGDGTAAAEVKYEDVRPQVERDYRLMKIQSAYEEMIGSELSTENVELFPERMSDDG
jgi:tetratricopeptide (TPR) repeat protein